MDRNLFPDKNRKPDEGQARKSLWIETLYFRFHPVYDFGQARKSLWIETVPLRFLFYVSDGQARKSLWIETPF